MPFFFSSLRLSTLSVAQLSQLQDASPSHALCFCLYSRITQGSQIQMLRFACFNTFSRDGIDSNTEASCMREEGLQRTRRNGRRKQGALGWLTTEKRRSVAGLLRIPPFLLVLCDEFLEFVHVCSTEFCHELSILNEMERRHALHPGFDRGVLERVDVGLEEDG